jgi:pimeloyl-ACP methyl ester carboxylesterase
MIPYKCGLAVAILAGLLHAGSLAAQLQERRVAQPTRLDGEFAARGFGPAAGRLPAGFDSTKQRYQLFVPKNYDAKRAWPLLLFISAGEQPTGWGAWQKLCEREGIFFASPFSAGNTTEPAPRIRIALDVLDDIRRAYRIDPDRTYLTGFSGGGRMACAIAFALPELFGGVIPLCGTNPLSGPAYLRHRIHDRLSVAFVTGEKDFNRKENEIYMGPWFFDLGIRAKVWVMPKAGHVIPAPAVHEEIYAWLEADLKRRQAEARAHPELALAFDTAPPEQARRYLAAAQAELKQPARTWRGVALVQAVAQRWGKTDAGKQARQLLQEIANDEATLERIADQGAEDEKKALSAQAWALERFGQPKKAVEAWQILAKNYEGTPTGRNAQYEIRRLGSPPAPAYLGLGLSGNVVDQLAPRGPAAKAGLKIVDVLAKVEGTKIAAPADLGRIMQSRQPGESLRLEVLRERRPLSLTIEVGRRPASPEK